MGSLRCLLTHFVAAARCACVPLWFSVQKHISCLLSVSAEPLAFTVVVPAWEGQESWQGLRDSRFTRHTLVIGNREHSYYEGAQQRQGKDVVASGAGASAHTSASTGAGTDRKAKRKLRKATSDTSVFFMRNKAGDRKWPITKDALRAVKAAFTGRVRPRAKPDAVEGRRGEKPTVTAAELFASSGSESEGDAVGIDAERHTSSRPPHRKSTAPTRNPGAKKRRRTATKGTDARR